MSVLLGSTRLRNPMWYLFVAFLVMLCTICILLLVQFRHRRRYTKHKREETIEEMKERITEEERVADEKKRGVCTFWFLDADFIRNSRRLELPRFQELLLERNALVKSTLSLKDACRGSLVESHLAVSHR